MTEKGALIVTGMMLLFVLVMAFLASTDRFKAEPAEEEQVIHVFTHTIDDREVRCIHFSLFGLSCDWTYGEREGLNP